MTKNIQDDLTGLSIEPQKKTKRVFRNWQDVGIYMKTMRKYPVVQKIKAESKDPKDDTFELVRAFRHLKDAQNWIADPNAVTRDKNGRSRKTRLSYLIWYLPEVLD